MGKALSVSGFFHEAMGWHGTCEWEGMKHQSLTHHLALAIAIKLLALLLIWGLFVRPLRVATDPQRTAAHLAGTAASAFPASGAQP